MKYSFFECKIGFSQSYFLSRVVKDARRLAKTSFFTRKNRLNTFPRTVPFVLVLQICGTALVPSPCGVWAIIHSKLHVFDRFAILSIPVASEIHES
jgi:hypothetical protein